MKVFVVVVPQDYMSAEIMAENAKANTLLAVRPGTTVEIQKVTLEG